MLTAPIMQAFASEITKLALNRSVAWLLEHGDQAKGALSGIDDPTLRSALAYKLLGHAASDVAAATTGRHGAAHAFEVTKGTQRALIGSDVSSQRHGVLGALLHDIAKQQENRAAKLWHSEVGGRFAKHFVNQHSDIAAAAGVDRNRLSNIIRAHSEPNWQQWQQRVVDTDPAARAVALADRLSSKLAASAKGIPDRSSITPLPTVSDATWKFSVQRHLAEKAGTHFDVRLGDPDTGIAHSWAVPKTKLPRPGQKVLAVRQPDHEIDYMGWSGNIPSGEYGAGKVYRKRLENAQVIQAAADKIRFLLQSKKGPEEYLLTRWGGKKQKPDENRWLLLNVTKKPS
jgi:DNA ligase D-like protein (predicted 3'-phosphoesterase)